MPAISIIIPAYNAEKCIGQCVKSILCQTYTDFEIVIVDDGSTDKTGEICKSMQSQDSRITYVRQDNSGVSAARNYGIFVSKGNWICFVDADDVVTPEYISAFCIDDSEADLVVTGIRLLDVNSNNEINTICFENALYSGDFLHENIYKLLTIGYPFAKAYKKEIIEYHDIRFPLDISFHEDHVFVLDYICEISSVQTKKDVTYVYNIDYTADTLSKRRHNWKKLYKSGEYMLERVYEIQRHFGLPNDNIKEALTFSFQIMIGSIYSIYDDATLKTVSKCKALKEILYGKYPISDNFFPVDRKGKLIKQISRVLPIWCMHIFFTCLNKYQNRNR